MREPPSHLHLKSAGPDDTLDLGRMLGGLLQPGDIVALVGPLGAGKTVLAQGIAQGMGVAEALTSPTYVLARSYPLPGAAPGGGALHHVDAYRVATEEEAREAGLEEMVNSADAVSVIEWADRIRGLLPLDGVVEVSLGWAEDPGGSASERDLVFEGRGARGTHLVEALAQRLAERWNR